MVKQYAQFSLIYEYKSYYLHIAEDLSRFEINDGTEECDLFNKKIWITHGDHIDSIFYIFEFENEIDLANTLYKLAKLHGIDIKLINGAGFLFDNIEWKI
jgi:hypothetical protein